MLAAIASVITQAICGPNSANASCTASKLLYGKTMVSPAVAGVTPGNPAARMWRRPIRRQRAGNHHGRGNNRRT